MKWPKDQIEIIENAAKTLLETKPNWVEFWKQDPKAFMWGLYRFLSFEMRNDDTHPAFANRPRTIPYNSNFVLYPEGCNDDHLTTVLKHILNKLEKEYKK